MRTFGPALRSTIASLSILTAPGPLVASGTNATTTTSPTFTKDVAPIFFKSCVTCHRPGEVAPMSLLTYETARPWARSIKNKVIKREMPPLAVDFEHSLPLRNQESLTPAEIATIAAWVDGGGAQGNPADMPSPPAVVNTGWRHPEGRPPDLVIEMPEFTVKAEGVVPMTTFYVKSPLKETKWVEAVQMMPTNREVVHHARANTGQIVKGTLPAEPVSNSGLHTAADFQGRSDSPASVTTYTPGRMFEQFAPGVGKRLDGGPDAYFAFSMHYQTTGKPERDRSKVGLWFLKGPPTHEFRYSTQPLNTVVNGSEVVIDTGTHELDLAQREADFDAIPSAAEVARRGTAREVRRGRLPNIPPYAQNWQAIGIEAFPSDITILSFWPHAHLRGKSFRYVLVYPDGRELSLLSVPKYDFNWQFVYDLKEPLKVPAGSKLLTYVTYDNSTGNKHNPAPEKEVYWSEQSWDEMLGPQVWYVFDEEPPAKTQGTGATVPSGQ